MIKVEVIKDNEFIKQVSVKGHAMYDEYGKDIVCAAVSSIVTTTINGILSIDCQVLEYEVNEDEILIKIKEFDSITNKLMCNMINLLVELQEKYPKNIIVK